jgi:DNA-binding LacI/PurR family transcriptional regulator
MVSDFTAAGGAVATARLLDLADSPTAVVYGNDVTAIAGIGVAHGRGVRVPKDLSVTGFDGTELAWGQAAAQALLQAAGRASKENIAEVNLAPGLLEVRSSTARPPRQPGAPRPQRRRIRCRARLEPPTYKEKL